ncbi:MAG: hypothetical protein AAGF19_04950 [Pseudomonadota bacterium]
MPGRLKKTAILVLIALGLFTGQMCRPVKLEEMALVHRPSVVTEVQERKLVSV